MEFSVYDLRWQEHKLETASSLTEQSHRIEELAIHKQDGEW